MTESLNLTTVPITIDAGLGRAPISVDRDEESGDLRIVQKEADGSAREAIYMTEDAAQALIGAIAATAPRRPGKPPGRDYDVAIASGTTWGPIELTAKRSGFNTAVLIQQEGEADEERGTLELDTVVLDAGKLDLFMEVLQAFRDDVQNAI
jgi:hypothetical protein